ncbi:MAG: methylated-DNA--[protein]-cysteine S-methyltransferase [Gammaproteobacteria bacterium]|nr:methylated-DNA--[protein]-cysteine S-methyltransferase [Gammaproteobacteria bacterium]MXW46932.1 methylated-DNA--[protein]-cysteine S-methyltransferase [Gammaproteobacteria bacterium]MYD02823.1 methylated-DNA--[protein]-cysteine S-methyltransferase [Gammaproteobacteria bacterium]MYI24400.1 methylated-DNA--[protein]-cysteine S-methyltransferase [Gammaproteobacteria bacterium]
MNTTDYDRIEAAIRYLARYRRRQPELADLAAHVGLSQSHLHRLFSRWAGVTPKRFLEFLTVQHAKKLLDNSESVLAAAYGSGLTGPGRLHDHFVTVEAVTPGEYRSRGAGLTIRFGTGESPFGPVFVAWTERGVCRVGFVADGDVSAEKETLCRTWGRAVFEGDELMATALARSIFAAPFEAESRPLSVHVRGTNFQLAVWRALLRVPPGQVITYGRLAAEVGSAQAARATGSAVGKNPIGFLIPCHRVIRAGGITGNYAGGVTRKRCMLAWEASRQFTGGAEMGQAGSAS